MTQEQGVLGRHTILRAVVGSTAYGLALEGADDRDDLAVYVEPIERVAGFSQCETIVLRTAAEREHRADAPSQPGDLDLTIHGLRKFCRLALGSNPTLLVLLFIPAADCLVRTARGAQLQELAPAIISRRAGGAFLGYLQAQRQRLTGERGQKDVRRPALEAVHGYDTKYAMHMLRLGVQGVELLRTGRMTLPIPEPERSWLRGVRVGAVDLQWCLTRVGELETEICDLLRGGSPLPAEPDEAVVERWVCETYLEAWEIDDRERWCAGD